MFTRRKFFGIALNTILAGMLTTGCRIQEFDHSKPAGIVTNFLRQQVTAARLGNAYQSLHENRQRMTADQLANELFDLLDFDYRQVLVTNTATFQTVLRTKIEQDFQKENVVKLEGWLLSDTESRICELLYRSKWHLRWIVNLFA